MFSKDAWERGRNEKILTVTTSTQRQAFPRCRRIVKPRPLPIVVKANAVPETLDIPQLMDHTVNILDIFAVISGGLQVVIRRSRPFLDRDGSFSDKKVGRHERSLGLAATGCFVNRIGLAFEYR